MISLLVNKICFKKVIKLKIYVFKAKHYCY